MLLEKLLENSKDYPHFASLTRDEYEVMIHSDNALLVHCLLSDIYLAEGLTYDENLIKTIRNIHPTLLETCSEWIFKELSNEYHEHYSCIQFRLKNAVFTNSVPDNSEISQLIIKPLNKQDLNYVFDSYPEQSREYMNRLQKENRLLGGYINNKPVGYVCYHIDGTLGALYVSPEWRRKGFGEAFIQYAKDYWKDDCLYTQVLENNTACVTLHKQIRAEQAEIPVYWLYDSAFHF